jgi:hypothetical protein
MAKYKKRAKKDIKDSNSNALIYLNAFKTTLFIKKTKKLFILILKKSTKLSLLLKRSRAQDNINNNKDNKDAILYKGKRNKYKLSISLSTFRTKLKKVTFRPLVPILIKLLTPII